MYRESVSTFIDLLVTLGEAPCHVQRVRSEISRLFGDTVGASLVVHLIATHPNQSTTSGSIC